MVVSTLLELATRIIPPIAIIDGPLGVRLASVNEYIACLRLGVCWALTSEKGLIQSRVNTQTNNYLWSGSKTYSCFHHEHLHCSTVLDPSAEVVIEYCPSYTQAHGTRRFNVQILIVPRHARWFSYSWFAAECARRGRRISLTATWLSGAPPRRCASSQAPRHLKCSFPKFVLNPTFRQFYVKTLNPKPEFVALDPAREGSAGAFEFNSNSM